MPRLLPVPARSAGAVALGAILLLLLLGLLGAMSLHRRPPAAAPPAAAPLPPPPSDTTFHYGWVTDSASPTGRNYVEAITIPVAVGQQYWLQIVNGAPGGTNRVDSLKGKWNGK
ncbi:MAG: hypothetical protein KA180_16765, partial [Gemmatimonadales bacterium]|nr:hypothetical protein [Gemmatimonadales bacterium]